MSYFNIALFLTIFSISFSIMVEQANASWNVWLDHSIKKYRQDGEDGNSGAQALTVKMAKNEFEGFQVFVYADGEDLTNVDVTITDFTKASDTIGDVYIYKEHYVICDKKSRPEYETGYYPDALLPKVDRYYNETRTTFPINVASGKVQGVWIDIGTETFTAAGIYTATVTVSAESKAAVQLPVNLEVYDFALPSTSLFPATFDLPTYFATYGHGFEYDRTSPVSVELLKQYFKMFLYHRTITNTLDSYYAYPYAWDSGSKTLTITGWGPVESLVTEAMNGTYITSGPYFGAKFPHHFVQQPDIVNKDSKITASDKQTANRQYLQQTYDHFEANGWDPFNRLFTNVIDEPKCNDTVSYRGNSITECEQAYLQAADANAINTDGKGVFKNVFVHKYITREGMTDFENYGFYAPILGGTACEAWNHDCSQAPPPAARDLYQDAPFWAYMGCFMNGCGLNNLEALNGQPDYSVDADAMFNRIVSFYQYKARLTGSYFWDTVNLNVAAAADPFYDMWSTEYWSNGDGHLLYPGIVTRDGRTWNNHGGGTHTPAIGGTHDIPIASIRWKYIRDSQEDLEYFKLAEQLHGRTAVLSVVNSVFTETSLEQSWWNLNMNPKVLLSARDTIASLISGNSPARPPASSIIPSLFLLIDPPIIHND